MNALADRLRALLPRRADYRGLRRSWPRDLAAGATVGVVALPLALAFAVASGVGPAVGLVTAVVAGAVAAVFGGSRVQVSGPTGAMAVVLVPLVAEHGPQVVYPLAVLAGLLVLAAGVFRLGRLLEYVPWPLVEGFTVGIAVVIAAQQVPHALGVEVTGQENAAAAAAVAIGGFLAAPDPAVLGVLVLTVLLAGVLPRLHRAVPAGLIAVVAGTLVAELAGLDLAVIGTLPAGLPVPALPDLGGVGALVGPAFVVAFLAALESLLSARVADGLVPGPRHDPDRELVGQGLANVASGLCGGMPATGAIARTAVNARAGAATPAAALTHAGVLAVLVLVAGPLVARIPLVTLAGVLLVTAWRMIERHNVRAVLASTRADAVVFGLTAVATVATDLVTAVEVGLAASAVLALVHLARTLSAAPDEVPAGLGPHVQVYRLDGPVFFAAVRSLAGLAADREVRVVVLRLSGMTLLDATGARALRDAVEGLERRGVTVLVKGATPEQARLLTAVGALGPVAARGHVFDELPAALVHAAEHAAREPAVPGCVASGRPAP
ncbi:SulP family inorganic anion transporter [Trujillonella endophytica]|uniref:Sulfate permease, SulP family n=1 Tax=Trujillonella endophytica TaxID=673521 RepID=A0A1H8PUM4_9ACTN|nr:SulP family inorganic anion transporter [Trujillella endophytica]SEO45374.1 sulfate permease, SulP family [Trujillella endophytica]